MEEDLKASDAPSKPKGSPRRKLAAAAVAAAVVGAVALPVGVFGASPGGSEPRSDGVVGPPTQTGSAPSFVQERDGHGDCPNDRGDEDGAGVAL